MLQQPIPDMLDLSECQFEDDEQGQQESSDNDSDGSNLFIYL